MTDTIRIQPQISERCECLCIALAVLVVFFSMCLMVTPAHAFTLCDYEVDCSNGDGYFVQCWLTRGQDCDDDDLGYCAGLHGCVVSTPTPTPTPTPQVSYCIGDTLYLDSGDIFYSSSGLALNPTGKFSDSWSYTLTSAGTYTTASGRTISVSLCSESTATPTPTVNLTVGNNETGGFGSAPSYTTLTGGISPIGTLGYWSYTNKTEYADTIRSTLGGNLTNGYLNTIDNLTYGVSQFALSVFAIPNYPFTTLTNITNTATIPINETITDFSTEANLTVTLMKKAVNSLPWKMQLLMAYILVLDLVSLILWGRT